MSKHSKQKRKHETPVVGDCRRALMNALHEEVKRFTNVRTTRLSHYELRICAYAHGARWDSVIALRPAHLSIARGSTSAQWGTGWQQTDIRYDDRDLLQQLRSWLVQHGHCVRQPKQQRASKQPLKLHERRQARQT
jgi:hypothetical protein